MQREQAATSVFPVFTRRTLTFIAPHNSQSAICLTPSAMVRSTSFEGFVFDACVFKLPVCSYNLSMWVQ